MVMWSLLVVIVMDMYIELGEVGTGFYWPVMWCDGSMWFRGWERAIFDAVAVDGSVIFLFLFAAEGV